MPSKTPAAASNQETIRQKIAVYGARAHRPPESSAAQPRRATIATTIDISQELAREQQLKNENAAQDIRLKRSTLDRLFWFLTIETALVFVFALLQATKQPAGFHLEDWSFRVIVGATIAQITGMLFVAVRYLFPNKK
jgi:uncharacterized integral membrane protein